MNQKYIFHQNTDKSVNLQNCNWQLEDNNLIVTWDWPKEQSVRLAIVFRCKEENPNIEALINNNHCHDVIVRDLAETYESIITEEKCKFIICPACFDSANVVVHTPSFISDWIHKKTTVSAKVVYTSVPLGQYKKATLAIAPRDIDPHSISYSIMEQERTIATYSLDSAIITGGGHLYIRKSQHIAFNLHPNYAHLIELV